MLEIISLIGSRFISFRYLIHENERYHKDQARAHYNYGIELAEGTYELRDEKRRIICPNSDQVLGTAIEAMIFFDEHDDDPKKAFDIGSRAFDASLSVPHTWNISGPSRKTMPQNLEYKLLQLRFACQMWQSIYTFHLKKLNIHKTQRKKF